MTATSHTRLIVHRRDQIVVCPGCGRHVRRKARQHVYCSTRCRMRANGAGRVKKRFLGRSTGGTTNPPKKINGANALDKLKSRLRAPPGLWREIVAVEVFGGRDWQPVVSSHGVICEIGKLRPRALVSQPGASAEAVS